jgi:hypothetical protein
MKEVWNICLFLTICLFIFIMFNKFNYTKEGMTTTTDASGNTVSTTTTTVTNGIAGNAAAYSAGLKSQAIKAQDALLINKYRTDYESSILNLDDVINNLMLKTALTVNESNVPEAVASLAQLNQAKAALNSVMKFIDAN